MSATPSPLIARLERMRTRIRRLIFAIGLSWTVIVVVTAGMAAVTLDYLVGLPFAVRLTFLLLGLSGSAVALYWLAIRPLLLPLSVTGLARHLEGHFQHLSDRLATAVQFLLFPDPSGSPALVQKALEEAQAELANVPLEQALNPRPAWKALAMAAGALVLAGGLISLDTSAAKTGLTRLLLPWSAAAWPKWVEIAALTQSTKVPLGESYTASARLARGDNPSARVWIVSDDGKGNVERHLMSRQSDGRYLYVFESVVAPLRYYFETRGDSTVEKPAHLTVVERPRVLELSATVTPPAYVQGRTPQTVALDRTSAVFTLGSQVELKLKANNPLQFDGRSVLLPVFSAGTTQPADIVLTSDPGDPAVGRARVTLNAPLTFRPQLLDRDNLTSRDTAEYRLTPVPDEIPTVVVTEPRGEVERTPNAVLNVLGTAEDDFALSTIRLRWSLQTAAPESPVSAQVDLLPLTRLEPRGDRTQGHFACAWDLARLAGNTGPVGLKPGDVVVFHVEAVDNYVGPDGRPHPPGKSGEYRIKIVTPERIAQIVRDEISAAKSRGRAIALDQVTLKDDTAALSKDLSQGKPLNDTDREQLGAQHDRQSRLAAQTAALSNQVKEIKKLLDENRIEDPEGKAQLAQVVDDFARTSREPMSQSARTMQEAASAPKAEAQLASVKQSIGKQEEAVSGLQAALAKLERWGEFGDVVRKAQEILDRQQQLSKQTGETGQKLLGKPAESLRDQEKNTLNKLAGEQEQLQKESDELLRRMEDLKTHSREQDPASADALGRAQEAAQSGDLTKQMNQAAQEMKNNRLGQAQTNQDSAQATLTDMIKQLQKREERELAELQKKVNQLKDAVEQLLREQEKLSQENKQTQAQKDENLRRQQFADQAARQELNRRNTAQVAQQIADLPKSATAAGATRKASSEMGRASGKLSNSQGQQAQEDQKDAEKDLKQAFDELEKMQKEIEKEQAKRSRAAIRQRLTALQDAQKAILVETVGIEKRRQERGKLLRKDQAAISELKTAEDKWLKELVQTRELTSQAEVYDWTLERCNTDGRNVAGRFSNEDTTPGNQLVQTRIIERLGDLIESLQDDPADEKFQKSGGGGSGGGQGGSPPVPPLAELKMLRALQERINRSTIDTNQRYNQAGEVKSEEGLKEIERLGTEQGDLKELLKNKLEKLSK